MQRVGAAFDLVGFLRFRLTGALGTDLDFAWSGGHIRSPRDAASWSVPSLGEAGLRPAQLPPIFTAAQRVSVVSDETTRATGLRGGTWVTGGGDPRSTRLLFAAEPLPGRSVLLVSREGVARWEVCPPPERWSEAVRPSALEEVFFHRRGAGADPRAAGLAEFPDAVLDWEPGCPSPDLDLLPSTVEIAADAGQASAGTAILAGLAIGWWRDLRQIFRKRRPPLSLAERRAAGDPAPERCG
jgi:hypothetical protein